MPWARSIEGEVNDLRREMERRTQNEINANKGQNGMLSALSEQIRRVEELALSSVAPGSAFKGESNFALDATLTDRAETSIAVPSGYTRAVVIAVSTLNVLNTSGAQVAIQVWSRIADVVTGQTRTTVPDNAFGTVVATQARELSGLSEGEQIAVSGRVASGPNLGAGPSNSCVTTAIAIFMR